jgi:hypothetical protein
VTIGGPDPRHSVLAPAQPLRVRGGDHRERGAVRLWRFADVRAGLPATIQFDRAGRYEVNGWSIREQVGVPGLPSLTPFTYVIELIAAPEPSTWAMMLFGFFGLGAVLRRKRSRRLLRTQPKSQSKRQADALIGVTQTSVATNWILA